MCVFFFTEISSLCLQNQNLLELFNVKLLKNPQTALKNSQHYDLRVGRSAVLFIGKQISITASKLQQFGVTTAKRLGVTPWPCSFVQRPSRALSPTSNLTNLAHLAHLACFRKYFVRYLARQACGSGSLKNVIYIQQRCDDYPMIKTFNWPVMFIIVLIYSCSRLLQLPGLSLVSHLMNCTKAKMKAPAAKDERFQKDKPQRREHSQV